ncbi:MAG: RnfABCDGE type electron transport complex subunit G [Bacteroidia bacterium]|jgi:electron transport complex protein RnfG|nr:RnfABCDGE type electron transport complex subunit G [Bacteroidia bacterium]
MAKKLESTFPNMVITLLAVASVAALSLGAVYNITKAPIEAAQKKKQEEAIRQVLPAFDRLVTSKAISARGTDSLSMFYAYQGDQLVGVAVNTYTNKGFSGLVRLMVGLLPDGTINNTAVLEHKETPGLGDKMQQSKSPWSIQFNGKNPSTSNIHVKKDGGEVDAITAATISSRAFVDAVLHAHETYTKKQGGQE